MTRKRTIIWIIVAAILAIGIWAASQSRPVQNLYFAAQYERTLDRYSQTDTTDTDVTARIGPDGREAALYSAFFGIDDALPSPVADWAICEGASGLDGMPVIFSHEVDLETLDPGDFRIVRASGEVGSVTCLTLAPADDPGELRTVLLAGQYGSAEDQPSRVEITGNILSADGTVNFKGAQVDATPLEAGPSMVLAQIMPEAQWNLGAEATGIPFGGGNGCPQGTQQIVRVTWEGGVTKPDRTPADETVAARYALELDLGESASETIAPFAIGDVGDGDNNHALCLESDEPPVSVSFPAGHLTDPRDDLNPATRVLVTD